MIVLTDRRLGACRGRRAWLVRAGWLAAVVTAGVARGGPTAAEDPAGRSWRRLGDAGAAYVFRVNVSNDGPAALAFSVAHTGAPAYVVDAPARLLVPSHGSTSFAVAASIPDAAGGRAPPFSPDTIVLRFSAADAPGPKRAGAGDVLLRVSTPGPLTAPGESWLSGIRAYAATNALGRKLSGAASNSAEKALRELGDRIDPPTEALWLEGPTNRPWHIWHWPRYEPVAIGADGSFRCPVCQKTWTPREVETGRYRFMRYRASLPPLGLAAMLTGDERYARPAREILLALAAVYRSFPAGPYRTRLGLNYMHECQFDSQATACMRRLQAAGMLSAADQRVIADGFLVPSVELLLTTSAGTPNQQGLRAYTIGEAGLVLDWPPYVACALRDGHVGWLPLVKRFIGPDGGWLEGSLSYHALAIQWVTPLPAVLHLYGYDVLAMDPAMAERLRRFFTFPMRSMRPDLRLVAINDAGLASPSNPWNAAAYTLTGEPALLPWIFPAIEYPVPPASEGRLYPWESRDFPDFGAAVLHDRAATNRENWVLLDYGDHGGGHGHFDKLNVVCYAHGQPIHDDAGSAYASPIQFPWLRNTVSHCTIVVDETGQQATTGRLDQWQCPTSGPQVAVASTEGAYPGTRLERAVILAAGAQVFIDTATSTNAHTYDWVFTCYGVVSNTSFACRPRGPLPSEPIPSEFADRNIYWKAPGPRVGYDVPTHLREGAVNGNWTIDFADVRAPYIKDRPPIRMRWLGWTPSPARVVWGDIPGFNVASNGMRWVSIRQEGREATWVTALVPESAVCVDELRVDPAAAGSGLGVQLLRSGSNVCWIAFNREPGQLVEAGPLKTRDRIAVRAAGAAGAE